MKTHFPYIAVFFLMTRALSAAWNSEYIESEPLQDSVALKIEQDVINHVKNSWCSEEKAKLLFELVVMTQPQVCVEIGAFTGSCSVPMVAGLKYVGKGHAYIIDAWSKEEAIRGLPKDDPNTVWWASLDMRSIKRQFVQAMASWSLNRYFDVLSMSSKQAVTSLPPIDFLHIDGNFSEEGAFLDSQLYVPKVVKDGYILLSNVLVTVQSKPTKMKALRPLFDQCDIVCELENGNVLLFKKK